MTRSYPAFALPLAGLLAAGAAAQSPPAASVTANPDRTVLPIARTGAADLHRTRRAQRHAAAALRGQGARGRAQRRDRPDRRPRLRRHQRLRRPDRARPPSTGSPARGCTTTTSTPPPSARRRARRSRAGATTTSTTWARSSRRARRSPATPARSPTSVAPLAEMLRLNGYSTGGLRQVARDRGLGGEHRRARSTAGRPARASTSSTASSAARPTSGRRSSTTAPTRSSCPTTRTTTS